MRRTERTPIDDNTVDGNLDKSDVQVIYAQFLSILPSTITHGNDLKFFYFMQPFQQKNVIIYRNHFFPDTT